MELFSGINCVLFREMGVIGFLSIFGRGSLEMGTEKLCMLALPGIPSQSVHDISLRKMVLVTLLNKRQ